MLRAPILAWYELHRRKLPMRASDVSPWGTLVFEVMSQQTPIPRVQPIWERWMRLWPTPADLAAASPAAGGMSQGMMQFLMLGLILVVFYFFLMRPQIKRQKELRKFQSSLKRGDRVMVAGGIYGKVAEVAETYIMVEIRD